MPLGTIIIFTDFAGCVGYLDRGWAQPSTTSLSRATRALWNKLKKLRTSRLFWIRGHSGIAGNDEADRLAKLAANKSKVALQEGPGCGGPLLSLSTLLPSLAGRGPKRRLDDRPPTVLSSRQASISLQPEGAGASPPRPSLSQVGLGFGGPMATSGALRRLTPLTRPSWRLPSPYI